MDMKTLVLAVIVPVAIAVIVPEIEAWTPRLTRLLVRASVRLLPFELRARLEEEWSAHLDDLPGTWVKLAEAVGLPLAALRLGPLSSIARRAADWAVLDRAKALAMMWFLLPLGVLIGGLVLAINRGPLLIASRARGKGGGWFWRYTFSVRTFDGRLGMFGRFMWASQLSELPVLINVLKGEVPFSETEVARAFKDLLTDKER